MRRRVKRLASAVTCFVAIWGLITVFAVIAVVDGWKENRGWLYLTCWSGVILIELYSIVAAIYYWIKEPWTRQVFFTDN